MKGLYLHIPFCRSKCPYCDFNSYAGWDHLSQEYVYAMLAHIRQSREQIPKIFDTIFIGGGTPTALSEACLEHLLNGIAMLFPNSGQEFTIEANPKTLTPKKLEIMARWGVNRISLGLQAWQDDLLQKIGRTYTRADFLDSITMIRSAGFSNINVDVTEREMNHLAKYKLTKNGIFPYEISNFAKQGYKCRHNLIYWKGQEYAAFGAGASGYLNKTRFTWPQNPQVYIQGVKNGTIQPIAKEKVNNQLAEALILGLRLTEGINIKEIESLYGKGCLIPYEPVIRQHLNNGLLQKTDTGFSLSERGFDLANVVMCDFL